MGDAHKRKINRGRIVCIGSAPVGKIARGISRVLYFSGRDSPHKAMFCPFGKASAIYPARRSPAGSSATYPPTRTGRPSVPYPDRNPGTEQHRCTWSCNPQSVRLPMSPPAPVALTPPFHPCLAGFPERKRAVAAVILCYGCTNLRPSGSFTSAAPCVARTFLPSRFAFSGAGSSGRVPLLVILYGCGFVEETSLRHEPERLLELPVYQKLMVTIYVFYVSLIFSLFRSEPYIKWVPGPGPSLSRRYLRKIMIAPYPYSANEASWCRSLG